jgi:hypothetical protein
MKPSRPMVLFLIVGLSGCTPELQSGSEEGGGLLPSPDIPVADKLMTVETSGGQFVSSRPAQFAPGSTYVIQLEGTSGAETWSAIIDVDAATLAAGSGTVKLTTDSLAAGQGSVRRIDTSSGSKEWATDGTLSFALRKTGISGSVQNATPGMLDAEFDGALLVDCWVPADLLPNPGGGTVSDDGSPAYVEDANFQTEQCRPLLAWK